MAQRLLLAVLIGFASLGVGVAVSAGFEWWQARGDTASRVVVPVGEVNPEAETGWRPSDTRAVVQQAPDTRAEEEVAYQHLQQPTTSTTLHPQVQAQGWEQVVAIVEGHSDAWPWTAQALDVAQISFLEELPSTCNSPIGCYHHTTGDIWLALDALRERDPMSFSCVLSGCPDPSDIVLHELAHAYTLSFPQGADLLAVFGQHYAGCRRNDLDTDRLVGELLADTMAMAATATDPSMPHDYGYFRPGGFSGCLAESDQPDEALFRVVYSTLFNCDSEHALHIYEDHHYPDPFSISFSFGRDADTDAVLHSCYNTDDHRDDRAEARLHEHRCADGVVRGITGERQAGWEQGCEDFVTEQAVFLPACDQHSYSCTIFVPADVECTIVDEDGFPPYATRPGLLDASSECIVPDCTVPGPQGERLPGHHESWLVFECTAIDRPQKENSGTND